MPTAHMSTDGCEALSAMLCGLFRNQNKKHSKNDSEIVSDRIPQQISEFPEIVPKLPENFQNFGKISDFFLKISDFFPIFFRKFEKIVIFTNEFALQDYFSR